MCRIGERKIAVLCWDASCGMLRGNNGSKMKEFLQRWVINTAGVLMATYVVKWGIHYEKPLDLIAASFLLGILFTFLRPLLMFFSLPLMIFTLGLFTFVINALLLYWVGLLLAPGFQVVSFKA